MKNLVALFSAKRVKISLNEFEVEVLGKNDLRRIRGGGQPIVHEENIIIAD